MWIIAYVKIVKNFACAKVFTFRFSVNDKSKCVRFKPNHWLKVYNVDVQKVGHVTSERSLRAIVINNDLFLMTVLPCLLNV